MLLLLLGSTLYVEMKMMVLMVLCVCEKGARGVRIGR